jgi:hypothetical protein
LTKNMRVEDQEPYYDGAPAPGLSLFLCTVPLVKL